MLGTDGLLKGELDGLELRLRWQRKDLEELGLGRVNWTQGSLRVAR